MLVAKVNSSSVQIWKKDGMLEHTCLTRLMLKYFLYTVFTHTHTHRHTQTGGLIPSLQPLACLYVNIVKVSREWMARGGEHEEQRILDVSESGVGGRRPHLGRVLLHGLEVEEGGVDQVAAMDDGDQLPLHVVAFAEAQHVPQLGVLTRHTQSHIYNLLLSIYLSILTHHELQST